MTLPASEETVPAVNDLARKLAYECSGCGCDECINDITETLSAALHATREQAVRECAENGWQTIETAPEVAGKYFFCRLAWGAEDDKCTGDGFRWNNRWFAGAEFYIGGPFDGCQYEIRQIEINPTHWHPLPTYPSLIDRSAKT